MGGGGVRAGRPAGERGGAPLTGRPVTSGEHAERVPFAGELVVLLGTCLVGTAVWPLVAFGWQEWCRGFPEVLDALTTWMGAWAGGAVAFFVGLIPLLGLYLVATGVRLLRERRVAIP